VVSALNRLGDVTVISESSGLFEHLDLQFSGGTTSAFTDPLVREAFLLTVPRQQILDDLVVPMKSDAELRSSFVITPGAEGYDETVSGNGSSEFSRVDIAGAKHLLAESGSDAPVVCVLFDPSNPRRVAEFTLVRDSAAKAGFSVKDCSRGDWEEFLGVNGAYDAALFAWNETTTAVLGPEARLASDSTVSNFSHYSSPEVDDLLAELAAETDASERNAILAEIDAELFADGYGVPLYQFPSITAHSDEVSKVKPSPLTPGLTWNLWEWQPSKR
jgi:peptide/nickel transport system substrate-binding protein